MRTTLVLDDRLFKKAKQRALALNTTVSDVVNQALRETLSKPNARPVPFRMLTFGGPAGSVDHSPADLAHRLEEEDASDFRDR